MKDSIIGVLVLAIGFIGAGFAGYEFGLIDKDKAKREGYKEGYEDAESFEYNVGHIAGMLKTMNKELDDALEKENES